MPAAHKLGLDDFTSLQAKFATLLGNAEDVAALACGWISDEEFASRMATREAGLVGAVRQAGITAQRRAAAAAAAAAAAGAGVAGGSSSGGDGAVPSTPVQVDCSLVPFRGGVWLMCSLCYGHVDEQGMLYTSKIYCVRFSQVDPTGANVLETPPYVSTTE
ncbi:hypothetical protein HXX76_013858 [Chlamydomonas incerta]|uniref:Uncharacterized protein n=1 Tax=Chlamydomonas incerta TaxID=51695 RepID=A0A835VU08_CHLIN|nr:hypothetical protein HXX76_013858 [Chlamydomonas incerta]|eukprot:KAG2425276.1 hypothetical protein HXX76_013858 [Chlamydomonas incerta]